MDEHLRMMTVASLLCLTFFAAGAAESTGGKRERRTSLNGERHFGIIGGLNFIGANEVAKAIDSDVQVLGSYINCPLGEHIDITLSVLEQQLDGWVQENVKFRQDTESVVGGVRWHLKPGEVVDPYMFVSFGRYESKVSVEDPLGFSLSKTVTVYNSLAVSAGAEIQLGNRRFLTPYATYYEIGPYVDGLIGCSLDKWLKQKFGLGISVSRDFRDGDIFVSAKVRFSF